LEDLSAVYKRHKELFFEDEKDKKDNILQLSSEFQISSHENNESGISAQRNALYCSGEPEIQPRNTIETSEYLKEIGIKDEMKKIQLYKNSHVEDSKRDFEKLNVENPINKVGNI
jgi:hypothetical protein